VNKRADNIKRYKKIVSEAIEGIEAWAKQKGAFDDDYGLATINHIAWVKYKFQQNCQAKFTHKDPEKNEYKITLKHDNGEVMGEWWIKQGKVVEAYAGDKTDKDIEYVIKEDTT